ncbi:MAG: hypothetical protein ACNS61_05525 [Candidatus Wenzhouxiangella sp. M2_3B_020]
MSLTAKAIERFVVPQLPLREPTYNGVSIAPRRFWQRRNEPAYEHALVKAIRNNVRTGDAVVVAGGGLGVSSVVAARHCGASGQVWTFEPVSRLVERVKDTARRNRMQPRITVRHALLGAFEGGEECRRNYGAPDCDETLGAADLPDADVWVLDIEGAEQLVLSGLRSVPFGERPRTIIVETHGFLGAPTQATEGLLRSLEYDVTWCGAEVAERDVHVLCGVRGTRND